jgi:hypothetical protein
MELSAITKVHKVNHIPVSGLVSNNESHSETEANKEFSVHEVCTNKLSNEDRCDLVAKLAYYKAQARGFESGHELDDWLAAEAEVDQ